EPCHSVRPVYRGLLMRVGALRGVHPTGSGQQRRPKMDCGPSQPQRQKGEAMSRHLLLVLLLASAVALADDKPKTQHAGGAAKAQKKKEAAPGGTERAQAKAPPAQRPTEDAQAKTQAKTEEPQAKTEEAQGQTADTQAKTDEGAKLTSVPDAKALGMSILGNQDAPKSLVIVPWKSSELGDSPGNSPMLDDSRQPVDKEVFMRALRYYEIRSKTKQ